MRDADVEDRAAVGRCLEGDGAAMGGDDVLHDGHAEADALAFAMGDEGLEDAALDGLGNSGAVITDGEVEGAVRQPCADF